MINSKIISTLSTCLLLLMACKCAKKAPDDIVKTNKNSASKASVKKILTNSPSKVKKRLQAGFLKILQNDKTANEAWALFSSSGWGDKGQIAVVATNNAKSAYKIYCTNKNKSEGKFIDSFQHEEELKKEIFSKFKEELDKTQGIDNLNLKVDMLDGLEHQYVHYKKEKGSWKLKARVYFWGAEEKNKEHQKHLDLLNLFKNTMIKTNNCK